MKNYRIPCIGNVRLKTVMLLILLACISSCKRDIDKKIEECYNSNDTIINLSDLYPEEWDTMYYFTNACNLEDMNARVGPIINRLWQDVGDRILIFNKDKIVCYKEYFPNHGQELEGALFLFKDAPDIVALPREKTQFLIRRRDNKSFWVIHLSDYKVLVP